MLLGTESPSISRELRAFWFKVYSWPTLGPQVVRGLMQYLVFFVGQKLLGFCRWPVTSCRWGKTWKQREPILYSPWAGTLFVQKRMSPSTRDRIIAPCQELGHLLGFFWLLLPSHVWAMLVNSDQKACGVWVHKFISCAASQSKLTEPHWYSATASWAEFWI